MHKLAALISRGLKNYMRATGIHVRPGKGINLHTVYRNLAATLGIGIDEEAEIRTVEAAGH